MFSYEIKYRLKGSLRWKSLTKIIEDGVVEGLNSRFFILSDNTRIEIPDTSEFVFAPSRHEYISYLKEKEKAKVPFVPSQDQE